jgi:1-aminocyclopropane-1-carboxylate deaminase
MLIYFDTPVQQLSHELLEQSGISLFIKREYQNHPFVSGNKWWKLKYNLQEAKTQGHDTLLTFGGAFSNHIFATAAAAKELQVKSIGIIRGEEVLPLNETLAFAKRSGMDLHFVSREDYKRKNETEFIAHLKSRFHDFYLIPEGGTNSFAVKGCAEFAKEKLLPLDFDYLCLPIGTGGTLAGIVAGLEGQRKIVGVSVLKNGEFLNEEVRSLILDFSGQSFSNWHIETDYHFGGYAKRTDQLDQFILQMKVNHNLPLDFVYTGKMVAGIFNLIEKKYFEKGSKILMLHTGGLRNLNSI